MLLETTTYLGPARVIEVSPTQVTLALPDEEVLATLALASPYRPAEGDIVLAIGQEEKLYVIGVIAGTGKTVLAAPGDLEFRARGRISLVSAQEVDISSPRVGIRAGKLELLARSVMERF